MKPVFVMIKCNPGQAYRVAGQAVEKISNISEIYSISGAYDLMAKFYLEDETDTGRFVTEQVQTLSGVADTFTVITFNAFTVPQHGKK
ncbi:Lrp/AsnC family transcriptional regulator [Haematospirillum sp. H1815]|uniref:Lrp/AsnC ligand binding domain-containing protein n=1 Tax=unclassified Haematospirillum TaxID=2622088 RepID=UPI00143ADC8E|nr:MULTISPECIES: Lrp/AsnC ligand binding domain-containing protein [unclassified Haematospirillum]NKD77545.1 Lrp/AsnC family transcriptional regulator [Haematospirillum sp. H1815]NKD87650.1 Lrp/AsnC family transcriptional regulator [Haematospirillum sp. 15-248]